MKALVLLFMTLFATSVQANFGQIVDCPDVLSQFKDEKSRAHCRLAHGSDISFYSEKETKIYIKKSNGELKVLDFDANKAYHLLDLNPRNSFTDVMYNEEIEKWVVYNALGHLYGIDALYLFDKDYDFSKFVLTFLLEGSRVPLNELLTFDGTKVKLTDENGKDFYIDTKVPTLEEIKEEAFNYFETRSTSWTFLKNGLGEYPSYKKVTAIFEKCEAIEKDKKREKCFKNEGQLLQLDILEYVKENFEDNYNTRDLIKYLGNEDKHRFEEFYIARSLFRHYKYMRESELLDLENPWTGFSPVLNTLSSFGSKPAIQFSYFLNRGTSFLSIGTFPNKPAGYSVRYAYYPVGVIPWEEIKE